MSKILFSYFKSYIGRISKLEFEASARRDDLLGAEEPGSKVTFLTLLYFCFTFFPGIGRYNQPYTKTEIIRKYILLFHFFWRGALL